MAPNKGVLVNISRRNKVIPVKVTLFWSSTVTAECIKVEPKWRKCPLTFPFYPCASSTVTLIEKPE